LIRFEKLCKSFESRDGHTVVLKDLNFHLGKGEFVTILGRSGSGKSTILDLCMGLVKPTSGERLLTSPKTKFAYVFQRPALLPWRNVWRNVALPLQIQKVGRKERYEAAMEALAQVGLKDAANAYPFMLSGGMAQRVAIARALVQDPDVFLMDEPFSALDPLLRENMNVNLLKLYQKTHKTMLFVTHAIDEAVVLSDRIVILENGAILDEFHVTLPRPRGFDTFRDPQFAAMVRQVRAKLPDQPNLNMVPQ
jgi:NitT/TauT family transport system ATP-binding protein